MRVFATSFVLVAVLLAVPKATQAGSIVLTLGGASDATLAANIVLSYDVIDTSSGLLKLDITNTSQFWDPRLTSFAFNTPGGVSGVSSFSSSSAGWGYDFDLDDIDTPGQYGYFDVAAVTGPNFNGGSPNSGIARNATASWIFGLVGSGMDVLTASMFVDSLSWDGGKKNHDVQAFITRFQRTGENGSGSDVAIPTDVVPVPEPATLLLVGTGITVAALRRRLRHARG